MLGDQSEDEGAPAAKRSLAEPEEDETTTPPASPSPSATEEAVVTEPTQREVWATNYDVSSGPYIAAVAAALALRPRKIDALGGALNACRLLKKQRNLDKRVAQVRTSFSLSDAPTYEQALGALEATTTTICPEFATFQQAQTAERAKQLRVAERRRKERERRREERAARAAEARAQREAEEQAQQEYVYYENCTAVENAGAAPIYAGEPGYSRDLDRDGDGVACEQ